MVQSKTLAQLTSLVIGVAYAIGGIVGFAYTGFSGVTASNGPKVFGILSVNPFHNVFHLVVGLGLLYAAAKLSTTFNEGALIGLGSIYIIATICGFIYAHIPVISVVSSSAPDNYLHLITGLTALAGGTLSASISKSPGGTTPASALGR
ncbi:MAG TPA: DUF4383 domain-containing protein [Solirubrobacteraceae bacterium]